MDDAQSTDVIHSGHHRGVTAIIGIDCATDERRIGVALGTYDGHGARLEQVTTGLLVGSVLETVADWTSRTSRVLIALDAPLGWPAGLGPSLHSHQAGRPLRLAPDLIFRRETDRVVRHLIGKQSLDVGADRIARTAHAALRLLDALRQRTGQEVCLAWEPDWEEGIRAIEVYPAGTLAACGLRASGYKQKERDAARRTLLVFLNEWVVLPDDLALMEGNHDALDAALCVLAGVDFLRGECIEPTDLPLAAKEGWIWVRRPIDRRMEVRSG